MLRRLQNSIAGLSALNDAKGVYQDRSRKFFAQSHGKKACISMEELDKFLTHLK